MTNPIKTAALTAALTFGGTSAFAANEFAQQMQVMDSTTIQISGVTTDEAGFVVVYDYQGGDFGEVLGMVEVNEGANDDVRVTLDVKPRNDVAAVLYLGEVTEPTAGAAFIEIDVED